jgi:sec-independent protein translocase protein TatB
MFLDPAKLLVILIVALVVLGPDKLPGVARQMGAAWGEIRRFRQRLETEVRGTFPDLPSTHQVAQAVRSPLAFLDQLADAHEREQQDHAVTEADVPGTITPTPPAVSEPQVSREPAVGSDPAPAAATYKKMDGTVPARRPVGRTRPWSAVSEGEPAMIPDDPSMN